MSRESLLLFLLINYSLAGDVWPKPKQITTGAGSVSVLPEHIFFSIQKPANSILVKAVERYTQLFFPFPYEYKNTSEITGKYLTEIHIEISDKSEELNFPVDESYRIEARKLDENKYKLRLTAKTCFGAMYGLETLSQLIEPREIANSSMYTYAIDGVPFTIEDQPRFAWRGMMYDTARHFAPKEELFQLLDAMAYTKLNVLHWHITDEQSFPIESFFFPDLKKGSWDQDAIYSWQDVDQVIEYARSRGILVVPEIDMPGHCKSWGVGYPDVITTCNQDQTVLNLANEKTYTIVSGVIQEMSELFTSHFFHLGVDEVSYDCYTTPEFLQNSLKFKTNHSIANEDELLKYFMDFVTKETLSNNKIPIVWEELLLDRPNYKIEKNVIIEAWRSWGRSAYEVSLGAGYKTLLATNWYLDWIQKDWQHFYTINDNKLNFASKYPQLAIGGEVCMWSEHVDASSRETLTTQRLEKWRCHASIRGVRSIPLFPDYCKFSERHFSLPKFSANVTDSLINLSLSYNISAVQSSPSASPSPSPETYYPYLNKLFPFPTPKRSFTHHKPIYFGNEWEPVDYENHYFTVFTVSVFFGVILLALVVYFALRKHFEKKKLIVFCAIVIIFSAVGFVNYGLA